MAPAVPEKSIRITWMGTASLRLETPETTILVDPFVQLPGGEHPNRIEDFLGADHVLITHAHLDHLSSVPELLRREPVPVYCTACAAELLEEDPGPGYPVRQIKPGDRITLGDVEVTVRQGRHIQFDRKLVVRTLNPFHLMRNQENVKPIYYTNKRYQEQGETVFYDLSAGGLHLQIMGSLALAEGVEYPRGADLLALPYQGNSDLAEAADKVLERLKPKAVLATHFDNAYPPLTQSIDTGGLAELIRKKYPECRVIVPRYGETVRLGEEKGGSGR